MIHLMIMQAKKSPQPFESDKPILTIGRSPNNDIAIPADNISSQHGRILRQDDHYIYRDLKSTNGSMVMRAGRKLLLNEEPRELILEPEDLICLASNDNVLRVERIETAFELEDEMFEQTILAEQAQQRSNDLETSLGEDFLALRSTVELAREIANLDSPREIGELACRICLKSFPKARRALFLVPRGQNFALETMLVRGDESGEQTPSTLLNSRRLIDRCLKERKGFLFLFEQDRMQAIATRVVQAESLDTGVNQENRIILCCPLFQSDQCLGFLEIEGPLGPAKQPSLTRRDLTLATLMGHLIAARLNDLAQQGERLKLARKATAGYLAATVGHCFKNLLVVPNSIAKLLPMCVKDGRLEELNFLLVRNTVNIKYLDILSNEFAAASKDPLAGFESFEPGKLLSEAAELINQIQPEKVQATSVVPEGFGEIIAHGAGLKRLLMNLTLNAVDAIFAQKRDDAGLIEMTVESDPADPEFFIMTVSDNGPGIPPDILENLREIFRQVQASTDALGELQQVAENVRSTKDQGFKEHYGLGFLFVCQTVNQHGGTLSLDAVAGEGTTFTIRLPRQGPEILRSRDRETISD